MVLVLYSATITSESSHTVMNLVFEKMTFDIYISVLGMPDDNWQPVFYALL